MDIRGLCELCGRPKAAVGFTRSVEGNVSVCPGDHVAARPKEEIRFVGGWQAPGIGHGPPFTRSGMEFSFTYAGINAWAVDSEGRIYNLAQDYSTASNRLVWVRVRTDIIDLP